MRDQLSALLRIPPNTAIFVAISISFCVIYADSTILSIALPAIQKTYNTTAENTLWVVNSYMLMRAILVFASGRLSDMFSHIKVFVLGLLVLAIASLGCVFAPHVYVLVLFRGLQGLGATLIFVSGLTLAAAYSPPNKSASRVGLLLSISLASMAVGPVLGGILVKYLVWQWIFYINIFFSCIAICLSIPVMSNTEPRPPEGTFDWLGFFLSVGFTAAVTIAFENSNQWGWFSLPFMGLLLAGLTSLGLFIVIEPKRKSPLINFQLFALPNFLAGCLVASFVQVGILLVVFLSIFLQNALGFAPMTAGLLMLPMIATGIVFSNVGGYLGDQYGAKLPLVIGTASICFGVLVTLLLFDNITYYRLLPLMIFSGIGMFMINGPVRNAMIMETNENQHGMVNAILAGMRIIMSVIGFAIIGAIIVNVEYSQAQSQLLRLLPSITPQEIQALMGLLSHTAQSQQVLVAYDGATQAEMWHIILQSYMNGFFWALVFVGSLALISLLLSVFKIKKYKSRAIRL